jgi:hypothetical protein
MKRRTLITLLVLSLLALPGLSRDTKRDWHTGKLVSIELGTPESLGIVTGTLVVPAEYKVWVYILETDTMTYGFSSRGKGWHERPRPFTIGNQVKFALDSKGNAFLIDESGKEFKASLVKKTAKQPAH